MKLKKKLIIKGYKKGYGGWWTAVSKKIDVKEEKMDSLPQVFDNQFYPEGNIEQFFMNFDTTPSRPEFNEYELNQDMEAQEKESPFKRKTWTKTTNAWV
jgi:hypothetical protein